MENKRYFLTYLTVAFWAIPREAQAMHIMEGFLPASWSALWFILLLPFLFMGYRKIKTMIEEDPSVKMLIGLVGAFAFVISALKIPSITGSSSHMTGIALGAILIGPLVMTVIGSIVLVFQALLLAHGGITTLGANAFSMAVAGPIAAYYIYKYSRKIKLPLWWAVFMAAVAGDFLTYIVTSGQLALAFPSAQGGVLTSFYKFSSVFAVTQIPLALIEGLLTVMAINFVLTYRNNGIRDLSFIAEEVYGEKDSTEIKV